MVTEIPHEAGRIDREEDERYGQAPRDEVAEQLRTREGRLAVPGLGGGSGRERALPRKRI